MTPRYDAVFTVPTDKYITTISIIDIYIYDMTDYTGEGDPVPAGLLAYSADEFVTIAKGMLPDYVERAVRVMGSDADRILAVLAFNGVDVSDVCDTCHKTEGE